ncbi:MAG: hypothetical protein WCL44_07040 [bacterium]
MSRIFRSRSGQTVAEYAIVAGMAAAALAILVVFLFTFKEYGGRILDLAGSEYP